MVRAAVYSETIPTHLVVKHVTSSGVTMECRNQFSFSAEICASAGDASLRWQVTKVTLLLSMGDQEQLELDPAQARHMLDCVQRIAAARPVPLLLWERHAFQCVLSVPEAISESEAFLAPGPLVSVFNWIYQETFKMAISVLAGQLQAVVSHHGFLSPVGSGNAAALSSVLPGHAWDTRSFVAVEYWSDLSKSDSIKMGKSMTSGQKSLEIGPTAHQDQHRYYLVAVYPDISSMDQTMLRCDLTATPSCLSHESADFDCVRFCTGLAENTCEPHPAPVNGYCDECNQPKEGSNDAQSGFNPAPTYSRVSDVVVSR
eukprot:gene4799-120_t